MIVAVGLILLLFAAKTLSSQRFLPQLGNQAANPFIILAIFEGLQFLDFSWMAVDDNPVLRFVKVDVSPDQISIAALYYISMTLLFLLGSYIGMRAATGKYPPVAEPDRTQRTASTLIWAMFVIGALVLQATTSGFSADVATISATKGIRSAELPILPMAQLASIISGGLYLNCVRQTRSSIFLVSTFLLGLAFITGARTMMFIVIILAITALSRIGVRITRKWVLFLLVPLLGLLTAYRYFFRAASWYTGSFSDFLTMRGGVFGVLFSSDEVSFAEVYSYALSSITPGSLSRIPGQSVLGLIMSPLPRAWLGEWKPLPAQADFNLLLAPGWADWKAGIVVGPYFDVLFEYSMWGSLVVIILYGVLFGVLAKKASRAKTVPYFWLGIMSVGGFLFLRTDMQTVGAFVWPACIVAGAWKVAALTIRPRRRTRPAVPVVA